ncbi:uncharacterized protein B0T15DRAFT_302453 [Chaetomium strumarium]|uniref:RRM domain-containing protein n=1 Tax=Chaetomium strumarium TaxID=1170767 RepID=A0AAJ0LYG4_9PEZI|nr:hypothetical protein B0T15DRAFT_302453 [Chaetomium strumarium]
MHRYRARKKSLVTVTVRPGSETGIYYILVANLAHSTTWKDLKAFTAQACEVDHAEVYPPTSGFVRVKGRSNFERAFKHLDGNTLDYRALQADARNSTQSTVVKLSPTDYHALRILRGDSSKIFVKPGTPTADCNVPNQPFPQGPAATMRSPSLAHQAIGSPGFNMAPLTSMPLGYPAVPPSYVPPEGLHAGAATALSMPPGPMTYQVVAPVPGPAPAHGFSQQVVAGHPFLIPQPMGYLTGSAAPQPLTVQYPYLPSPKYYPEEGHDIRGHGYAGYVQPADYTYSAGYGETLPTGSVLEMSGYATDRPPSNVAVVVVEQRKIVILNLERETLSEAVVVHLIARHTAGLGTVPGEIEGVEVPVNKDGRARGIAFVTFISAELASVAIAALDGREVPGGRGKKLEARLAEGVPPRGGGGGPSISSGGGEGQGQGQGGDNTSQRRGGKAVGGSNGTTGENKKDSSGKPSSRSSHPQSSKAQTRGAVSSSNMTGAVPPRGPAAWLAGGGANNGTVKKCKEERPVIVNGSGGRWMERLAAPVVVNGSAGRRGYGGYRSCRP